MDIGELKRCARREASLRREAAHEVLKGGVGDDLTVRGLDFTPCIVSGFFPFKSEISVLPLLARLHREGWLVAMPVVVGEGLPLLFRSWSPGEALARGVWGIPVPAEDNAELEPDVLLVPMLAFDRRGYRLGYGGGYYDRTLLKLRAVKSIIAIGVAYAAQETPEVPREDFDQALDYIMTEKETFKCG